MEVTGPQCLLDRLQPLLPSSPGPGEPTVAVEAVSTADGFRLRLPDGTRVVPDVHTAVEVVLETVNRVVLEQCRDFAVHAGAVARDGRVLALPADSGSGKTTLTAALLRRGWEYVSDEALVLAPDGRVRPYPKWLSMHAWTLDRLGLAGPAAGRAERPVGVRELSAAVATGELRLAHLVLPRRRPGALRLEAVDRAASAAELLRCSFNHYRDPTGSVALTAGLMRGCRTLELSLDDPVAAAELLGAALD